jgi:predicted ATPase/DNA-binding CsgD family transcriptional regulator
MPQTITNLPPQPTRLIGRQREIGLALALLREEQTRLLTLTGPGGVGKTQLAVAVALSLAADCPDGIWFVDLTRLADPALLWSAIAQTLGIRETRGRPIADDVLAHIAGRRLLLILDNFEHLMPARLHVGQLLAATSGPRLLVTSRERLRLRWEHTVPVPPLAAPQPREDADLAALLTSPSVALFLERARAVAPDFELTTQIGLQVGSLCARLDGLPLAIELAAARANVLSPAQMLARLRERAWPPTWGVPDAPDRHQTLQDAIGWSYDLLPEPERLLFRRLSVFSGGWTLEEADAVAATASIGLDGLDGLSALIDKSLVTAATGPAEGEPRFAMLETVREYAAEQLRLSGEEEATRRLHAGYFLHLAEAAEPEINTARQQQWLAILEQELPNVRAALQWLYDRGDDDWWGLRLATALWRFWWVRSHYSEGRAQLARFLVLAGPGAPSDQRARALQASGELAFRHGAPKEARRLLEQALEIRRAADDRLGTAETLRSLGRLALDERRHPEARTLLEASLAIERELGYRRGLPWVLSYLSWLAEFDQDYEGARALLDEGLAACRELGDEEGCARFFLAYGRLAIERQDLATARARTIDALSIFARLDYQYGVAYALEALANVEVADGQPERGRRIGSVAARLRETTGVPAAGEFRVRHERSQARACDLLGADRARAAWALGQAMSVEQVLAEALAAGSESPAPPSPAAAPAAAPERVRPLTPRELEVLRLVAQGRTQAQIARALVITVATVKFHVASILSKLEAGTRAQAVAIATQHGIL